MSRRISIYLIQQVLRFAQDDAAPGFLSSYKITTELIEQKEKGVKTRVKVAITGAAGQIGYALIFRIASGQMFGPETEIELNLLELEAALPSLKGVAMELEDCAFPLLKNVVLTSEVNEAMKEVNWALLVGAVPRK